jgi:hypothetical protein
MGRHVTFAITGRVNALTLEPSSDVADVVARKLELVITRNATAKVPDALVTVVTLESRPTADFRATTTRTPGAGPPSFSLVTFPRNVTVVPLTTGRGRVMVVTVRLRTPTRTSGLVVTT